MQSKKEFFRKIISLSRGGLFFGFGILIAGIGYAVVTLTIGEKQDDQNNIEAGQLPAGEFNQLLSLTRGLVNNGGNIGIGINPTAKLHVSGNVLATGNVISDSSVVVAGNMSVGTNISVPNELCQDGYVMDGFNGDGSISCVEMPTLEARIIDFSADPGSADYNTSIDLSWTHENVSTCTLSCTDGCPDGWANIENTVENTVETGILIEPSSFILTCTGSVVEGTVTESLSIDINPATVTLTADPAQVVQRESTTLTWTPQSAINCQGTGAGGWAGEKDPSGGSEVDGNINNDTTYTIRCNGLGNQYDEVSVTVTVIEEEFEVQATVPGEVVVFNATTGDSQVTLNWSAPSDGGSLLTGYRIERDSGDGAWWLASNPGPDDVAYTDIGLINGTTYQYRIRAINDVGDGIWSGIVSVTPSVPENLGVTLNYVIKQDVEANIQQANMNGQYPLFVQGWTELRWETTGNPTNCTATENDFLLWNGNKDVNGGSEVINYGNSQFQNDQVVTHTITCSDALGNQVSDSVAVQYSFNQEWVWADWRNMNIPNPDDIETAAGVCGQGRMPSGVSCRTTDGIDWRNAGKTYTCYRNENAAGGNCYALDNNNNCLDYKINILCGVNN